MAITNPDLLDRPIASTTGQLAAASQVIRSNDENAETALGNLESAIFSWKFNGNVLDATNPGADFLALNNALKDNVTIISFHVDSNIDSARFDEMLARLRRGTGIFLQERATINNSIFYRVTGNVTVDGTKVNVPVVRERDQGGEFTHNNVLNVAFFPQLTTVDGQFLDTVSQTSGVFNLSALVQILDQNLNGVTLPVNAPYDALARFLFGGGSIQTEELADRVEYNTGYSQGIDYRDNAAGIVNDDTHYVDVAAGMSVTSNLASSTVDYATGTTFERLVVFQIQLNAGNTAEGAMLVMLTDPGGSEREFLHITASNNIEIDPSPNAGGTHVTVGDVTGSIVIDDGSWIILEFIPVGSTGTDWRVVPAILKADGTRIQGNDVDVDLNGMSGEALGFSRSANQRGQILQYKTIQIPSYLRHSDLSARFDHIDDKWCLGFARLFEGGSVRELSLTTQLRAPVINTLAARDISGTAIGGTGNSVLTLPTDYTLFEQLMYTVVEDAGQTTNHVMSTRYLEANATISDLRISGNDTASWNLAARTLTLDSTTDTWVAAALLVPRVP